MRALRLAVITYVTNDEGQADCIYIVTRTAHVCGGGQIDRCNSVRADIKTITCKAQNIRVFSISSKVSRKITDQLRVIVQKMDIDGVEVRPLLLLPV